MVFWANIQLIRLAVAIGLAAGSPLADLGVATMLLMLRLVSLLSFFM
jgi:hypothetical protein